MVEIFGRAKCPLKAACYFRFLWEWYLAGIWRIAARTPMLLSSFYCGALSFDSHGTQSYVLKQKGPKCVILKPQTSLESESFLVLFDPDASRLLTRSCHFAVRCVCKFVSCNFTTINKGEDDE